MTSLSALAILLLLSAGAFLLPALVGGRARAIAGIVIGGIALFGLLVLAVVPTVFRVEHIEVGSVESEPRIELKTVIDKRAGDAPARDPEGIALDPVQFERERAEIERLWQEAELERHMWHTASLAGGIFIWLAIATAYLKLDLLTAGRYRNRLRLGAAVAFLLGTAASVWAWMIPL